MNYLVFILSFVAFQAIGSSAESNAVKLKKTIDCVNEQMASLTSAEQVALAVFMKTVHGVLQPLQLEDDLMHCLEDLGDPPVALEAVHTAECIGNIIVDSATPTQDLLYGSMNGLMKLYMKNVPSLKHCS
ncbi:hypothetical protein PPYR_03704 [Photinus pyralis]|uniref:Uncharacterized protein n=2 Tax=Photinus pyralis TaxID=7054 RepID=A0A5N4A3I6_PHOPY|nr:uncharacterized protein LOC116161829 [Photinus pyralis]KAB0791904.1 hypothetical protein PPYR_03704 [Photinus pyralis]